MQLDPDFLESGSEDEEHIPRNDANNHGNLSNATVSGVGKLLVTWGSGCANL